jgi:hypothetical protein
MDMSVTVTECVAVRVQSLSARALKIGRQTGQNKERKTRSDSTGKLFKREQKSFLLDNAVGK